MLEQLETQVNGVLALEVSDHFTKTDEELLHRLFQSKLDKEHNNLNLLIKLDEGKIPQMSLKVFMEHLLFVIKNVSHVNRLALVARSSTLEHVVPYIQKITHLGDKRYFDLSQLEKAMAFVTKN